MKEYEIGDIVDIDGIKYIVKEDIEEGCCTGCAFYNQNTGCMLRGRRDVFLTCNIIGYIFAKCEENKTKEEPLDLTKILDGCPYGTKFYSVLYGEVNFVKIANGTVYFTHAGGCTFPVCHNGLYVYNYQGECIIFPSKEQRDWSKFVRFWDKPKKEHFDPKTLQPFNRVLVRYNKSCKWKALLFSHYYVIHDNENMYVCGNSEYMYCIPFDDNTKHLVGTKDEAPEYYRYWKD